MQCRFRPTDACAKPLVADAYAKPLVAWALSVVVALVWAARLPLADAVQAPRAVVAPNASAAGPSMEELEFDFADVPFEVVGAPRHVDSSGMTLALHDQSSNASLPVDRKPIIWVHVHKAAGSFMCWLAGIARERVVQPNHNCNWAGRDDSRDSGPRGDHPSCAERKDYFGSHIFTYGQVERELYPADVGCKDFFNYGVMLREPVDMIHSYLNFVFQLNAAGGRAVMDVLRARLHSPRPQPSNGWSDHWMHLDNFQTRMLANALDVPAGRLTQEHLARARQVMDSFQVVARLEDLPTRGSAMFEALGWPSYLSGHIGNKRMHVSRDVIDLSPAEASWLREVNHLDVQLFHGAAGRPYAPMPR